MIARLLHLAAERSPFGWVRATATTGVELDPLAFNGKALTSVFAVSAGQSLVRGNVDTEEVTGSNPVSPTRVFAGQRLVTDPGVRSRSAYAAYIGSKLGAEII